MLEERSENFPGDKLEAKVEDEVVDEAGGEAVAEVDTQLPRLDTAVEMDEPSSFNPTCGLWFGAEVMGGGGGADWTPDPPPYKLDKLFMVMAELWFQ